MIKKLRYIFAFSLIVFMTLLSHNKLFSQDIITIKAAYMERFTRFVEWPDESFDINSDDKFKILVLGENPFGNALEILFSTTKIKDKEVKIYYSKDIEAVKDCHMVYISSSCKNKLEEIVKYTRDYTVLSVGDTEGYAIQGVMINFIIEKDVLRFELNRKELENSNLKVSHLLVKVAKTTN